MEDKIQWCSLVQANTPKFYAEPNFDIQIYCKPKTYISTVNQTILYLEINVQVLRRPDGASRGFGFVTYADESSVEKCLVMRHQLNGKQVELKRALSKDRHQSGGGMGGSGGSSYPSQTGILWLAPICQSFAILWLVHKSIRNCRKASNMISFNNVIRILRFLCEPCKSKAMAF